MLTSEHESLLPSNRTTLTRAFEEAIKLTAKVENPYPWLLDPQQTLVELLDYLASESGVSDWYSEDSEKIRRDTVEQAPIIMREAGTIGGLKNALVALGFDAEIEKGEKEFSLDIVAFLDESPLSEDAIQRVNSRVEMYKSERDTTNVNISRQALCTSYIGVTSEIGVTMTSEPYVPSGFTSEAACFVGVYTHIRLISTSEPARQ